MNKGNIAIIEQMLQHAETLMMQAEFAAPEMKAQIYQEAKDELIRAEGIMAGSGAWLMSCLHAHQMNEAMCIQWLTRAQKTNMLPDLATIQNHPHYKRVKDEGWFLDWVKSVG